MVASQWSLANGEEEAQEGAALDNNIITEINKRLRYLHLRRIWRWDALAKRRQSYLRRIFYIGYTGFNDGDQIAITANTAYFDDGAYISIKARLTFIYGDARKSRSAERYIFIPLADPECFNRIAPETNKLIRGHLKILGRYKPESTGAELKAELKKIIEESEIRAKCKKKTPK
jgi:hypothetical protein